MTPKYLPLNVLGAVVHSFLLDNTWCQKVNILKVGFYGSSNSIIYWLQTPVLGVGSVKCHVWGSILSWYSSPMHLNTEVSLLLTIMLAQIKLLGNLANSDKYLLFAYLALSDFWPKFLYICLASDRPWWVEECQPWLHPEQPWTDPHFLLRHPGHLQAWFWNWNEKESRIFS